MLTVVMYLISIKGGSLLLSSIFVHPRIFRHLCYLTDLTTQILITFVNLIHRVLSPVMSDSTCIGQKCCSPRHLEHVVCALQIVTGGIQWPHVSTCRSAVLSVILKLLPDFMLLGLFPFIYI
jgi:hypothetical protein